MTHAAHRTERRQTKAAWRKLALPLVATVALGGGAFDAVRTEAGQSSAPIFPGVTFEERRQAYIADQGRAWETLWDLGAMKHAVWAWFEQPDNLYRGILNRQRIRDEIEYYTLLDDNLQPLLGPNNAPADCEYNPLPQNGFKNCHFTGDHQTPIPLRMYLQYYLENPVIQPLDAQKLQQRLATVATTPNIWCAVANYNYRYLVTGYLYTTLVEDVGDVEFFQPGVECSDEQDNDGDGLIDWPADHGCVSELDTYEEGSRNAECPYSFTYGGNAYVAGRGHQYPSRTLYRDWLGHRIEQWLRSGDREDFGVYYYAQVQSMAALADFASDPQLMKKGEMFFDFLIFNWATAFSANHPAGAHGRYYRGPEERGEGAGFPWLIFFDFEGRPDVSGGDLDAYAFTHDLPQLLADIVEARGEGSEYYRIIRGHDPSLGDYRYDYLTPDYNLGGAGMGTGWELNIKSESVPFKLFINDCATPYEPGCNVGSDAPYLFFMGKNGFQHRNAMFVASGGTLQQSLGTNAWDEQGVEGGWRFFREGKVAVAVKITNASSALEVATIGVDYPTYQAFKEAITTDLNRLTPSGYTTTHGVTITYGYVDYGTEFASLPFDRLEAWEGHVGRNDERKLVDWDGDVMTVSKDGLSCRYDFNTWSTSGDGCDEDTPPTQAFGDVPPSHWAFSPIEALYRAGYVVGCNLAPRLFCPQQTLTRAQAAVLIDRGHHGADVTPEMPTTPPFSDVPLSHWAVDWVDLLKRDGLTAGCSTSESLFCPEAPNTRAETTVFLLRIKHGRDYLPEQPGQQVFLDVAPSDWFADWVTAAYREGLTEGCDEPERLKLSHFRPLEPITRAEAACMMVRAKGLP